MDKLLKIFGSLAVLLVALNVNAQKIEFEETTHDFGEISEEIGTAVHVFKFKNTGDKPLVISNVGTSCGCTVPNWTKEPVKPGSTGEIVANYKPGIGSFNKSLTVSTNASTSAVHLYIKGNVVKKPEDLKVTYPQTFGKLNAKDKRDLTFAQIDSKQTSAPQYINVANTTSESLNISFENVPPYILVSANPEILAPNQKGLITVSISGEKTTGFGFHSSEFTVNAGGSKETVKVEDIVAEKIEQQATYPVSDVEKTFVDLGNVTGNKISGELEILNAGNQDLVIKSFTTSNKLFKAGFKKEVKIKQGKKGVVKFTAANLPEGENTAYIYLSTNDPAKSLLKFSVKAIVPSK
ncbi:MAG: DUF1573 domain-containing protein [Prevotellaceae bacterium]|jgi:hypothetical protein|nr:DUF1573 domain-containing protein [Prevotellaceae bacterium]